MAVPPEDSSLRLPALAARAEARPASRHEEEVIRLFDQLRHRLLRYLLSFGLPAADSEEIIQEVFLALFRHLEQGKSRENLQGWIFRVAHNLGLKRRQANRANQSPAGECGAGSEPPEPGLNPEEQAHQRQRQERLQAVLRALPEQDRHCLYLRAEGLRYREIAGVLGISLGAVAQSLERSLARLRRADGR